MSSNGSYRLIDTDMVIRIINMILADEHTTAKKMSDKIDTSIPTIRRTIKRAREVLGVDIQYHHSPLIDDPGRYEIHNYGILDKAALDKKAVKLK